MKQRSGNFRIYLNIISSVILLIGLSAAVFIYRAAENETGGALGYQIIGGEVYRIMPENSKIYRHDLEVFGGKAAVLADDLRRWFAGLWEGKSLACTIAFLTVLVSIGGFAAARYFPSREETDAGGKGGGD
ncbi:MAG TPA: hypothetical protein VLZ07_05865 [Syntrophales bacterium]|nr:hypothetical protein [Syntrophales bacterium]